MYTLIKKILFLADPESVHYWAMNGLQAACGVSPVRSGISRTFNPNNPELQQKLFGLTFRNPVGLAAGFDKNARYLRELRALGFGSVEIGTVTPLPQDGNERPRLFRLPQDEAVINRMGFNNDGVKAIKRRLAEWKTKEQQLIEPGGLPMIIGGNIGKNKVTPNEEAWKDYERCFNELADVVDYFVVNVSSPNTPGLRELQEKDALRKILSHLQTLNRQLLKPRPLLLKIAPDLTQGQLDDIIDLAQEIKLDGLVATNTTISRERLITKPATITAIGAGGLSGKPVRARSTEVVRYITDNSNGQIPIIAAGGIFTAQDAQEKLDAGAKLVQVWSGFIYEGPAIVKKICKGLI